MQIVFLIVILAVIVVVWRLHVMSESHARVSFEIAFLIGLLVVSISILYGQHVISNDKSEFPPLRAWNVYHYYINAKYFDELGYFDVYNCTVLADLEAYNPVFSDFSQVRNLETYGLTDRADLPGCPKSKFSSERWGAFKADIESIFKIERDEYWRETLKDKGFNPTPIWVMLVSPIANAVDTSSPFFSLVLYTDALLIIVALVAVAIFVGIREAVFISLFTIFYFGAFGRLAGNYFQYIWFTFALLGMVALKRKKEVLAGVFLSFSTLTGVFPIFLIVGPAIKYFRLLIKTNKNKEDECIVTFIKKLFASFSITSGLLVSASFFVVHITDWVEFLQKMSLHSNFIVGEGFNMGFRNFLASLPISENAGYFIYLITLFVVGYMFVRFVLKEDNLVTLFTAGSILIYFCLTLSPYYYLLLAILLFISITEKIGLWITYSLLGLISVQAIFNPRAFISLLAIGDWVTEVSVLVLSVVVLCILWFSTRSARSNKKSNDFVFDLVEKSK